MLFQIKALESVSGALLHTFLLGLFKNGLGGRFQDLELANPYSILVGV